MFKFNPPTPADSRGARQRRDYKQWGPWPACPVRPSGRCCFGPRTAGPVRPPWCFSPATGSLDPGPGPELGRTKASSRRTRAGWQLAVQKTQVKTRFGASF